MLSWGMGSARQYTRADSGVDKMLQVGTNGLFENKGQ